MYARGMFGMGYSYCIVLICMCVHATRCGRVQKRIAKVFGMHVIWVLPSECMRMCVYVVNSDEVACIDVIFALLFAAQLVLVNAIS